MKKTFKMIGMLLVAVILAGNFSSCSKDDDKDADPFTHDQKLVGTWVYDYTEDGVNYTDTFVFKADGTFTDTYTSRIVGGDTVYSITDKGEWQTVTSGGNSYVQIVITSSNESENVGESHTYEYSFDSNNILYLGGIYFVKK